MDETIQPQTPQTETTQTPEELFAAGFERYQAGEGPDTLIPIFKEVCDRAPKNSSARTSLAWLYLLGDKPEQGYKAAKSAVKLNPHDPQAQINLALAMLELKKTGVRAHVELAGQMIMASSEWLDEIKQNIEDGLSRKPNWKSLIRVKQWLFETE
ncbi:MAG: tetratricopeptide repeat protein [Microcoleaceae cyanobacterium]